MQPPVSSRKRTQLALVLSALVFVAIGVGIYVGARRSLADAARVAHTHEVIGRIDEIQARLLDAESNGRGYLLTGNDGYLLEYQSSTDRLPILLEQLRRRVADNPAQTGNVDRLRGLIETRLRQIQHVLDLYEQHGIDTARAAINGTVFRTTAAIREQALVMVQQEQALLAAR
ncbi:GGDEF domain-containing protein, partial [Xanthomonas sp. Kuri4-1]